MRARLAPACALVLALATSGCGSGGEEEVLTVFAAASLGPAFEQLAERFEADHDGVRVELGLAGSSDLVAQVEGGAPADVLATADERTLASVAEQDLTASPPRIFATNTLQVVVPADDPGGVRTLADLGDPDLDIVVCAPEVPCGAAAEELARAAGVELRPDSEEQSVTDVLGKVRSGEADAGLVYVTDVIAAGDAVLGIDVPQAAEVVNRYPIAPLADSDEADLATQFVDLVLSAQGQQVLADAGFGPAS